MRYLSIIPHILLAAILLEGTPAVAKLHAAEAGTARRYEFSEPHMGLLFRIILYAQTPGHATGAAEAAFARIEELNTTLSDYLPSSELNQLSQSSGKGKRIQVSKDLWNVLSHAASLSRETKGAFDVTVGPHVRLWRQARRDRELPSDAKIREAAEAVGYRHIKLHPESREVELLKPGMQLDLGGIAKGYALDEAMKVLKSHDIQSALIAGGGDLLTAEAPPGRSSWRVAIVPLDTQDVSEAEFANVTHTAVATSGDLFQYVEIGGTRYSHIVDPRTGMGLTNRSLVTVMAKKGMVADSCATAASVLGPEKGLAFLEEESGAEGRIVYQENGSVKSLYTTGFPTSK